MLDELRVRKVKLNINLIIISGSIVCQKKKRKWAWDGIRRNDPERVSYKR